MILTVTQLAIVMLVALVALVAIGVAIVTRRKRKVKDVAIRVPPAATHGTPQAPTRRRQLQSFVDTEWDTPPEPLPEATPAVSARPADTAEPYLPTPAMGDDEAPAGFPEADHRAPEMPEPESREAPEYFEPEIGEPDFAASASREPDYGQAVLDWLEEGFAALEAGDITLDTYREALQAEADAIDERVAALEAAGDDAELEITLGARESVRWCLDWADGVEQTPPA